MNSLRMASGSWNWVPFRFQPLEVIARIEAALEALTDNETSQRIQLLVTLAEGIYFVDPRRSATLAAGAVELARAEGCDADLADAIIGHLICTVGSEAPGPQLERLDASEAIPGERPPSARAHAALHRWRALTELGDRARADDAMAAAEQLARSLPLPAFRAELRWARLTHRVLRNDLGDIETELEEAADSTVRSGCTPAESSGPCS